MRRRHGRRHRKHLRAQPGATPAARGKRVALVLLGIGLLALAGSAAAQVYKWKDEHGVTHYGDTPPARGKTEVLKTGAPAPGPGASPALPYELARVAQASPVLLYTTARCDACDQGRALLRERGIPFAERTVNTAEDEQQLRRLSGGKTDLPLLMVGSRQLTGYQTDAWHEALSSAAYPRQQMLPPGYQFAPPAPAAGTVQGAAPPTPPVRAQMKMPPDEAASQAAGQQPRAKQPAAGNAPPDFQF